MATNLYTAHTTNYDLIADCGYTPGEDALGVFTHFKDAMDACATDYKENNEGGVIEWKHSPDVGLGTWTYEDGECEYLIRSVELH